MATSKELQVPQDIHIHTVFSTLDSMVVEEQTMQLIASVQHAEIIGISDHLECLSPDSLKLYIAEVKKYGFKLGTEVDGHTWIDTAMAHPFDYYLYHCFDTDEDYKGASKLLLTGKPVIISHPAFIDTDLSRVPEQCYVEINNRYIWRCDWDNYFTPFLNKFKFIISSDAHQPWMLNQVVARHVANELGIKEEMLFNVS